MELIRASTKFDFLGKWKLCMAFSGVLMALSIWSLAGGINRGIDFAGGTEIQVKFAHPVAIHDLRAQLDSDEIGDLSLQRIGKPDENEFLIRVGSRQAVGAVQAAEDPPAPEDRSQPAADDGEAQDTRAGDEVSVPPASGEPSDPVEAAKKLIEKAAANPSGASPGESPEAAVESPAPEGASKSEQTRVYKAVLEALKRFSKVHGEAGQIDLNVAGEREITRLLSGQDQEIAAEVAHALTTFRRKHKGLLLSHDQLAHVAGMTPALLKFVEEHSYLGDFTIRRVEFVGPKVGRELAEKAYLAMVLALAGMLIYITVRFRRLGFALGAILALVHDGVISAGVFNLWGGQFDLTIVAAILTLLGYSINDTIVIFDRVREDMRSMRGKELSEIFNLSINQTLSRTLLTSLTTLLVVICLYQFGGDTLHGFAFILLFGIIAGTYSTIFIASPIVIGYLTWMDKRQARKRRASRAGQRRPAGSR